MADRLEDVEARVSAPEARADAEMTAVQDRFAELRQFITFSLHKLATRLRAERREDLLQIERRFDGMARRFDRIDVQTDAQFAATQTALQEILSRLPEW
jgi:hypothetical protein